MEDVLGGEVVLDDLVLDDPHAGLLDRHGGEGDALIIGCDRSRAEYGVDLLLGVGGVSLLGSLDALDEGGEFFLAFKGFCCLGHGVTPCLCDGLNI